MSGRVENINPKTLIECRTQMGISIEEAQKKVQSISKIEEGTRQPTFKQLDTLASLYGVPRWVFISESLPKQYQLNESPTFRRFTKNQSKEFDSSKVRRLVATVENLREFVIDIRNEMDEPIGRFSPPDAPINSSIPNIATGIRGWLGVEEDAHFEFKEWKSKLEDRGIFIFLSDKYKGWSHVEKSVFRGLSIWHSTLPVVIINDSDSRKAQSFTLFHELGHLLRKESFIDDVSESDADDEKWCDELAGNVLMPTRLFRDSAKDIEGLDDVKSIAKKFKVSPFACAVRLRQLGIVSSDTYSDFFEALELEYQESVSAGRGFSRRDRAKEVFDQYGSIYTRAVLQAYNNEEIGLHKLCKLFGLKRASQAMSILSFELGKNLRRSLKSLAIEGYRN